MESSDSSPQPISSNLNARNSDLYRLVFGIDLLREMILDFVIHERGQVSRANASSCRLVQRSWKESVTKCLSKSGEHLFLFKLMSIYDLSPHTPIQQFLEEYASPSPLFERPPPYSLTIYIGNRVPVKKSKRVLRKFLSRGSTGLVSLNLSLSCHQVEPLMLPWDLSLPVLHKVNLLLYNWHNTILGDVLHMSGLQAVLSATKKLKCFSVAGVMRNAVSFDTLRLPDTITNLELLQGVTFYQLDQLVRSSANIFPRMTSLVINLPNAAYDGKDSIYRILDRVRWTLKTLEIEGGGWQDPDRLDGEKTPIHFPTMKSLKSCFVTARNWKWAKDAVVNLERSLPAVKHIKLSKLTPTMFRNLVENSRFESAEGLDVVLKTEKVPSSREEDVPLALTKLPDAFPNITVLDISLGIRNDKPRIFHQIFQNMPQLKTLSLLLLQPAMFQNPDHFWTIMFLGMLPEAITATTIPYVTKLSELRILQLKLEGNFTTVLPDAVFQFGFLKMPKLLDLSLIGHLRASPTMEEQWDQGGRVAISNEYLDETE